MGDVSSYLMSVTLRWVAEKVGFAADLPIFRESSEGSKRVQVDPETVEKIQQRQPDWRRQLDMAVYLTTRRHHKFPPLLLVGYQGWVYEERHDKWGVDARAMNDSLTLRGLEPTGTYWDLDDTETQFYALDGQHRLMAILGLRDIIQTGQLHALDEKRNPKRGGDCPAKRSLTTYTTALVRATPASTSDYNTSWTSASGSRSSLRCVRKRASARPSGGFDRCSSTSTSTPSRSAEANSHSSTRPTATASSPANCSRSTICFAAAALRMERSGPRSTQPGPPCLRGPTAIQTLDTLAEIVRFYLKENKALAENGNYASWDNLIAKGVFVRPEDSALERGKQDMDEYFDYLATIPSHVAFIQGKPASELRKSEDGEDNILFRPVVQIALAEGPWASSRPRGVSFKNAIEELGRQEQRGQLRLNRADRSLVWRAVRSLLRQHAPLQEESRSLLPLVPVPPRRRASKMTAIVNS